MGEGKVMTRRYAQFIVLAVVAITALSAPVSAEQEQERAGAEAGGAKEQNDPLSILLITVDDMNWDSVGVYGAALPNLTPNIDALAAEGLRFENAHVTIAICQPTRARCWALATRRGSTRWSTMSSWRRGRARATISRLRVRGHA